jgi:hypothetical protein
MISTEYFFEILEKCVLIKSDKYYLINNDAFKKLRVLNMYEDFIEELKPHYKKSKLHYLTRPPKYTYFTTIIRHICKANGIMYSSKIKYDKSNYEIIYYIYKTH